MLKMNRFVLIIHIALPAKYLKQIMKNNAAMADWTAEEAT